SLSASAEPQPPISSLHTAFDPQKPNLLKLTTESLAMERGPRFKEYSALRERKLRMNRLKNNQPQREKQTKGSIIDRFDPTEKEGEITFRFHHSAYKAQDTLGFDAIRVGFLVSAEEHYKRIRQSRRPNPSGFRQYMKY
ncbi:hypothetical protein PHJA_002006600, partial [Phtheirospermum japonicum]